MPSIESIEHDFPTEPSMTSTVLPSSSRPKPSASSLDRNALLAYAYHLYDRPGSDHTGLTAAPLDKPIPTLTQSHDVYKSQLLPLLVTLRVVHPQDVPVLLLLACTYHALGDYDASLRISQEILTVDPNIVSAPSHVTRYSLTITVAD